MNLAQMINRVMQDYGEPNFNKFPQSLLKDWFNEAQYEINKEAKCVRSSDLMDAVNNQRVYSYPSDILSKYVDEIFYGDGLLNSDYLPLTYKSFEDLKLTDPYFYTRTGYPVNFYHDPHEGKFGLYPYEMNASNMINKIKINYRGKHTKMTRLYSTGTVTMSASTSVTGSGTTFTGNVIAGDEIGIGKLLDASRAIEFPSDFNSIQSVNSNTGLTLTSAYAGATGSGLSFITASKSSFVDDEYDILAIYYVIGLMHTKDGDRALGEEIKEMAKSKARNTEYTLNLHTDKCTFATPSGSMVGNIINDYRETRPEYN